MKQFILKLLKLFLAFCLLGIFLVPFVLIIFNLWILPSLFKNYVQDDLSRNFQLNLSYKSISYDPMRGIIFKDLSLEKRGKGGSFLVKAGSTQIDVAFSSLIKRSLVIKNFRISECQGYHAENEKKPVLFSLKDVYGSLHQERIKTVGIGGWLGSFVLEDLSFDQKNLSIEKARCSVFEREGVLQDVKIFWLGYPLQFEGLIDLEKQKMDAVLKLSNSSFLFAHYESKKIQTALLSNQTKLLSVTDLKSDIQKPFTWFHGFLNFKDFSPMVKPIEKKVSFKSPVKLAGWLVGLDFGGILFNLDSILIHSLNLEQIRLRLDFYRHRFLMRFFEAKSCDGFLKANGWVDSVSGAYKGWFSFGRLNLNCLRRVLFPKGDRLRGILSGDLTFLGLGNFGKNKTIDPVKNIEAEGNLEIQEGTLWKIQVMKGVLKIFEPISNLGKIRVESGTAHYFIRSGDLFIQDLKMMSPTLMMKFTGKMDLKDKNLDIDLHASVKPLGLKDKTFLSKLISGGLMMAGDQIWKAKISGTLKKPVITPLFFSALQPVKNLLEKPFQSLKKNKKNK